MIARIAVVVFSVFTYMMLIYVPGLLINIGLIAMSGTAQIIVPLCGAFFWKRSTAAGAITGLMAGISVLVVAMILMRFNIMVEIVYAGIIALMINGFLFVTVSRLTPERSKLMLDRLERMQSAYKRV